MSITKTIPFVLAAIDYFWSSTRSTTITWL